MKTSKYNCKTHGCVGLSPCRKYSGICVKSGITQNNITPCRAHGNYKCENKIKVVEVK